MPRRAEAGAALAPAKVNLTLRVTGRRADGYHLLDSLVVFAGVGDVVRAAPAAALTLAVGGPAAAGVPADGRNLVLRAAEALRAARGVRAGAALALDKRLPHGGGIGGGSSDAAAALGLLARLWDVPPLGEDEALALGADVPVCRAAPAPARMTGIGEGVAPVPALPAAALVLVGPDAAVPTPAAFAARRGAFSGAAGPPPAGLDAGGLARWAAAGGNDLTEAALAIAPAVGDALAALRRAPGLLHAAMSGSGAVCYGLAPDLPSAERAAAAVRAARPGWWVAAAPMLAPGDQAMRATT